MKEHSNSHKSIKLRNKIIHTLYTGILKPIFFQCNPEVVHDMMVATGEVLGAFFLTRGVLRVLFGFEDMRLEQTVLGMYFKNPIGLGAGFDKNAQLLHTIPCVGFGFIEIGSITASPYAGNPRPWLWRLPKSRSLVVYYGLKNDGAEVISKKIKKIEEKKKVAIPFGTSIAMTNCTENVDISKAIQDYTHGCEIFSDIGDYFTINISCPNTLGGVPFLIPENLEALLVSVDTVKTSKPIFVKFSPDLSFPQIDVLLDILKKHRVHGIICTNLTKNRNNPKIVDANVPDRGGLSGKVVQDLSDALLAHIYRREQKRFVLVGLGGVFSAEDAYKKIRLGATLVQIVTGMIFEGPQVISEINRGLCELLARDGFKHVSEAIGVDSQ